ncbi:MAG: SHOCT domain-containing protein [Actinomycetia bacterium]|nr:SHOCT domain-containing protein [Actinomycetes bacterium]
METFGNLFLTMLTIFFFVAYLMLLFFILTDLFRDKSLNGWWKAVWVLALIIFPILTALIYLIARGGSMQERAMAEAQEMKKAQDQYIQSVVSQQDPAEQIAKAKQLHEQGVIDDAEFEKLKAKALA